MSSPLVCQCQYCGRVRVGDVWTRDPPVEPDVVGHCPTCGELRLRQMQLKYAREGRTLLRRRAKRYGPGMGDPFAGFREGE
jgi:hypothetical protein